MKSVKLHIDDDKVHEVFTCVGKQVVDTAQEQVWNMVLSDIRDNLSLIFREINIRLYSQLMSMNKRI